MTTRLLIKCIILLMLLGSCGTESPKADLVIMNAEIWTGNEKEPSATAMAIASDTILAIGNKTEINRFIGDASKVIDLKGGFVTPGFIDSHVHLLMGGNALLSVALRDANTKDEFKSRIAAYAQTLDSGEWILEGNWDHTLWGGELPSKDWIDEFTTENPVVIFRMDGHMVLANSMALDIAGINRETKDLEGGEILRNDNGVPTGILRGSAMTKMLNAIPPMTSTQKRNALTAATSYLLSFGVTSVHDVDSLGTYAIAKEMLDDSELAIRIYSAQPLNRVYGDDLGAAMDKSNGKWLKTGLMKGFVDGSLGSHTAAFSEEYSDRRGDFGFFITDEQELYEQISRADSKNMHVTVHAIGDMANSTLLQTYGKIIKENGSRDRRFRIEHAQHLKTEDIDRFGKLGIIASAQPYHAIDDGRWAEKLIGPERIKTTYAFRSLINGGAILAFGSDWPVAPASPILGIYAATTRRTLDDQNPNGWVPKEKVRVEEALRAYTKNGAYASFDEQLKGILAVGKLADFVILNEDITKIDPIALKDVKVLETYVGGQLKYKRNSAVMNKNHK